MNEENQTQNSFQIHQGSYLNARLNKLLEDIDRYSLSPNAQDPITGYDNYKLLMRSLNSVAIAIFGEVSEEEKKMLKNAIKIMESHMLKQIVKVSNANDVTARRHEFRTDHKIWSTIKEDILEFRLFISTLLEKYGLGVSFEKSGRQEMLE